MKSPTLKDKVAYYAKVREANYVNSLRLEGFVTSATTTAKSTTGSSSGKKSRRNPV